MQIASENTLVAGLPELRPPSIMNHLRQKGFPAHPLLRLRPSHPVMLPFQRSHKNLFPV